MPRSDYTTVWMARASAIRFAELAEKAGVSRPDFFDHLAAEIAAKELAERLRQASEVLRSPLQDS